MNYWVRVVTATVTRLGQRLGQPVKNLLRPARTATTLTGTAAVDAVRPRAQLVAENAFLRQQLLVLRRTAATRPQSTRQRERQMRRFTSQAQLLCCASVHGTVQNVFRVARHLLRAVHHRLLRRRAFVEWETVTRAC